MTFKEVLQRAKPGELVAMCGFLMARSMDREAPHLIDLFKTEIFNRSSVEDTTLMQKNRFIQAMLVSEQMLDAKNGPSWTSNQFARMCVGLDPTLPERKKT